MGLVSTVLAERADSVDVGVVAGSYSFVADAKVFRLSRTAKNQKDFKVQAMDNWKQGKPFAMVVCPLSSCLLVTARFIDKPPCETSASFHTLTWRYWRV